MPNLHALLMLSDSALPLGSFAFSSGLESFLAHRKKSRNPASASDILAFINHSLLNLSSTALPFVTSAYRSPIALTRLDNDFDAATPCTVSRRASTAQGKALLTIWDRALRISAPTNDASIAMDTFSATFKKSSSEPSLTALNAHFPPLFGAVCAALDLGTDARDVGYLFLLNHAKAILSAAVRSGSMGPYQSQTILASKALDEWIRECVERDVDTEPEDAAVSVPGMDLWMGRHELLYSRIFNS